MTELEPLLMNAGLSTTGIAILLLIYRLFKTAKGKKCISSCCGRKTEIGFDIGVMTPHVVTNSSGDVAQTPLSPPPMTIRMPEQSVPPNAPSQLSLPVSPQ
jgi:hypothetical protein